MENIDILPLAEQIQQEIDQYKEAMKVAEANVRSLKDAAKRKLTAIEAREKACGERELKMTRDFEELNRRQGAYKRADDVQKQLDQAAELERKANDKIKQAEDKMAEAEHRMAEVLEREKTVTVREKTYREQIRSEFSQALVSKIIG